MPKLKNVTQSEILAAEEEALSVMATVSDLADRMRQGYSETIEEPITKATSFLALSRAAGDLAHKLLSQASRQEQAREIEALHRERAKLERGE